MNGDKFSTNHASKRQRRTNMLYKFKIIQQIHENLRNTNQRNHQEVPQEDSCCSFQSQNYRRGKCLSRKVIKDRLALPLHRRAWNADVVATSKRNGTVGNRGEVECFIGMPSERNAAAVSSAMLYVE